MSPDIHTATGAYAADALSGEEREEFEAHLLVCDACAQEVRELRATVARIGAAQEVAPPPAMRARVLEEIARTRQLPPPTPVTELRDEVRRRWFRTPVALAAAALLVVAVALGGVLVQRQHELDQQRQLVDRITAAMTDPQRIVSTVPVAGGGTGTVVAAHGDAVFLARGLTNLPGDRTYELWVINASGARPAGLLGRGESPVQQLVANVAVGDTIGLTVEPAAGSKAPTTKPVLLAPVKA